MRSDQRFRNKNFFIAFGLAVLAILALTLTWFVITRLGSPFAQSQPTLPSASHTPTSTPVRIPSATTVVEDLTPTFTPLPTPYPTETALQITETTTSNLVATPIPLGSEEIQDFTFAVCGDNRGGDQIYLEILRRVKEDGAAFFLNTGDLVNHGTANEFQHFADLMNGFTIPFFPVAGNHDSPDGSLNEFLEYSGAPAEHYSFDYGQGHFVVIDSHHGGLRNSELAWLEMDLSATDQPLKMVFLHHPPYDPDGTDHIMLFGNETFMELVEAYDVAYVFAGHIHAYVEGFRNDVQYIITGGCGAPLYGAGHPLAFFHYIRVSVSGTDVTTEVVRIELP